MRRWDPPFVAGAVWVIAAFAASHAVYYARGVRFDVSTIPRFDQFLDPVLLRSRLLESVWNMHSQPPLFNLLTGLALKLRPTAPGQLLCPFFIAVGLYTALCLYVLAVRLQLPVVLGALLASAVVISPPFILHEHWYFYPHLNVAWLVGGFAWLAQGRARPGPEMTIAAAHWAGLSLTRSLFHPLFFGLLGLLVIIHVGRGSRRKATLCFLLPGLLLCGWVAKNGVLFGFFGTSSWGSRNVSRAVSALVGPSRISAEARLGHLSPASRMGPFESGDRNVSAFGLAPRQTGVPALDEVDKQVRSGHTTSYNHWSYPASARFYAADVRALIEAYPATYLDGLRQQSLPNFLRPVDDDSFLLPNRDAVKAAVTAFDAFDGARASQCVLLLGLVFALFSVLGAATPRSVRIVLSAALFAIAWVLVVGVVGELGENNRFRFKVLWLSWIVAVTGYAAVVRAALELGCEWAARAGAAPRFSARLTRGGRRDEGVRN